MKYTVINSFKDKTNEEKFVKKWSKYETNEQRAKELQEKGFLSKEVKSEEKTETKSGEKKQANKPEKSNK